MLVDITKIRAGNRLRQVTEETVIALVNSIAEVGLINPITVYRCRIAEEGIAVEGFGLVTGLHRLEAHKRLGLLEIEAHVVEMSELHRQLAEVDENLLGTKLTPAERALFTKRRKEIYEALHPETRAEAFRGNRHTGSLANAESAFARDTATKTGASRRTVEMEAARGAALGDDLAGIKGTSLDKGVELDALARMDADTRRDLVARARDGEAVSARQWVSPDRAAKQADTKELREQACEDFAEWLSDRATCDEYPMVIAWLEAAKAKPVIDAFRRLNGAVFDKSGVAAE